MSADTALVVLALLLPWLCGAIWVRVLLRSASGVGAAVITGYGFFLGVSISALVLVFWHLLGFDLSMTRNFAAVVALGLAGVVCLRLSRHTAPSPPLRPGIPRWQVVMALLLLALLGLRYATLLLELLQRPLYAWDAWMNWAPKPVVWFHLEHLVQFVAPERWLQLRGEGVYTLGNRVAAEYPNLVPLIQLWSMLALGTWDSSLVYLPWLIAPVALALALYGHLRLAGLPMLWSVVACYLLLSMPYLNVHSVLVGYADHWLGATFALAVFGLFEWQRTRLTGWLLLWIASALMCTQLKNPGFILAAIVICSGLLAMLRPRPLQVALVIVLALGLAAAMLAGFSVELPWLGRVALEGTALRIEQLGVNEELQLRSSVPYFARSFFSMINWHLLFYLLLPVFVFGLLRNWRKPALPAYLLATLLGCLFLWVVFSMTRHYQSAINFHTLNRALLFVVPALLFCAALQCRVLVAPDDNSG